ncbi:nucleotidyltransferase domain-containing protein [Candidatus Saganbacteria bacterium]|nr:nucleotidyltransferase domain-containing protein [Candidatus Saganbacteria bacterium]
MIDISENHLALVKEILHKYLPGQEVLAFGSRITDNIKKYSDFDLVLVGEKKVERKLLVNLKEAFEESNIPFRIDLLDWHRISGEFKKIIQKKNIVIQSAEK